MWISSIGGGLPFIDVDPSKGCCVSLLTVNSMSILSNVSMIGALDKWALGSHVSEEFSQRLAPRRRKFGKVKLKQARLSSDYFRSLC
ncbi:unnamed protein product [Rhizophagus irregularis]|nr:unnamed protein product [Rhizophagus irregularis]